MWPIDSLLEFAERTGINTDLDVAVLVSWTSFTGCSHQKCFATIAGQTSQCARATITAIPSLPCRK